ncbi:MAG: hypothetical protein ABI665_19205 [Vicinamibacterales bacterium]
MAAVFGLVFLVLKVVLWTVFLPIRILFKVFFKVLMIPVWLAMGAVGLVASAAALPILLTVGAGIMVLGLLAAVLALLLPAIPFILLGLAVWAVMRRRPVAVS